MESMPLLNSWGINSVGHQGRKETHGIGPTFSQKTAASQVSLGGIAQFSGPAQSGPVYLPLLLPAVPSSDSNKFVWTKTT